MYDICTLLHASVWSSPNCPGAALRILSSNICLTLALASDQALEIISPKVTTSISTTRSFRIEFQRSRRSVRRAGWLIGATKALLKLHIIGLTFSRNNEHGCGNIHQEQMQPYESGRGESSMFCSEHLRPLVALD